MLKVAKSLLSALFICLIVINLFIFVSGIKIGSQVNSLEKNINKLKKENLNLENKVVELDSYQYAASLAATLDFTARSQPIYIGNPPYAQNQ